MDSFIPDAEDFCLALRTLPAGYMEMGESAAEGAARETLEEACAHVQVLALFAHIDIPLIGQVWNFFPEHFFHTLVGSILLAEE